MNCVSFFFFFFWQHSIEILQEVTSMTFLQFGFQQTSPRPHGRLTHSAPSTSPRLWTSAWTAQLCLPPCGSLRWCSEPRPRPGDRRKGLPSHTGFSSRVQRTSNDRAETRKRLQGGNKYARNKKDFSRWHAAVLACSICYLGSLLASGLLDSTPCSVKIYNVRGRHPAQQQHIRHSWALLFFYWARLTFVLFMPHYRHLPVWRYNTTKQHLVLLSLSYILFSVFFCCFFFHPFSSSSQVSFNSSFSPPSPPFLLISFFPYFLFAFFEWV